MLAQGAVLVLTLGWWNTHLYFFVALKFSERELALHVRRELSR